MQAHQQTCLVEGKPARAWLPVSSPFGGPVRFSSLERALEFGLEHVRRTGSAARIVREADGKALAVHTQATASMLTR